MDNLKYIIKSIFNFFSFELKRYNKNEFGYSLNKDVIKILQNWSLLSNDKVVIFDVGSNIGQSINIFNSMLSQEKTNIVAFEPSPRTFKQLQSNSKKYNNITCVNKGIGSENGIIKLYENNHSDISSFLKPTSKLWGNIKDEIDVEVTTIDNYCRDMGINNIDLLKIDTQGFDFEVVKGAKTMIEKNAVKLVQMEITMEELYEGLPRIDLILKFMLDNDFKIVGFYGFHNKNIEARWTDALFIHNSCIDKQID